MLNVIFETKKSFWYLAVNRNLRFVFLDFNYQTVNNFK